MKPIPILTEPTSRYFIFPNGQIADVYALLYDAKVDLENMMFISIAEWEGCSASLTIKIMRI